MVRLFAKPGEVTFCIVNVTLNAFSFGLRGGRNHRQDRATDPVSPKMLRVRPDFFRSTIVAMAMGFWRSSARQARKWDWRFLARIAFAVALGNGGLPWSAEAAPSDLAHTLAHQRRAINSALAGNNQIGTGQVHYNVQIHMPKDMPFNAMNIYVAMTDERGILVAPVQAVHPGLSTYTFNEFGPKLGTRTASLIFDPLGTSTLSLYCLPDSQTGFFKNGVTYLFNLYPTTNPPSEQ